MVVLGGEEAVSYERGNWLFSQACPPFIREKPLYTGAAPLPPSAARQNILLSPRQNSEVAQNSPRKIFYSPLQRGELTSAAREMVNTPGRGSICKHLSL